MATKKQKIGKAVVLDVSGELKLGPSIAALRRVFRGCIDDGERYFVFNMLKVPWIDSSGIGEIVACYKRTRDVHGELKVVMKGKAHDLFTFYELHKVCELHETLNDALGSFAK
ncbi:MAG TPA: STAS domain-containing protein [Candidatus Polarisedimenticolaceae bacterium]|nr:STAS domain-containing protein [Candidatus Polarisedimenticolaceae bacterium]